MLISSNSQLKLNLTNRGNITDLFPFLLKLMENFVSIIEYELCDWQIGVHFLVSSYSSSVFLSVSWNFQGLY